MALTREQVVQWLKQMAGRTVLSGDKYGVLFGETGLEAIITLARADLEATIAEQAKEIDDWKKVVGKLLETIPTSNVIRASGSLTDAVQYFKELHQQLQSSQAREAQLREWIEKWCKFDSLNMDLQEWFRFSAEYKAMPPDDSVLREYGAKLVERISGMTLSTYALKQIANQIREGTFK